MLSLNWIIPVLPGWITVVVALSMVTAAAGTCPYEVKTSANECFTAYSLQLVNMMTSSHKLCCGIDVETLRAFCDSYRRAVSCISRLRNSCHKARHIDIDAASVNFDDNRQVLHELCYDDNLIEKYAMHQTCLGNAGPLNEQCFVTHLSHLLHGNQSFRFLTKISHHRKKEQVCLDMYNTINCVKRNIESECGSHPAGLATILVKPMVSLNTECNYTVIEAQQQKTTKNPHHSHNALISDKHTSSSSKGKGHREVENAASGIYSNALYVITSAALVFVGSLYKDIYS